MIIKGKTTPLGSYEVEIIIEKEFTMENFIKTYVEYEQLNNSKIVAWVNPKSEIAKHKQYAGCKIYVADDVNYEEEHILFCPERDHPAFDGCYSKAFGDMFDSEELTFKDYVPLGSKLCLVHIKI